MGWNKSSSKLDVDVEKTSPYKSSTSSLSKGDAAKKKLLIQKATFVLIGFSTLNVWNSLLALEFQESNYYAFQLSGLVLASIGATFINLPKILLPFFLFGLMITCFLFQIAHFYVSDAYFIYTCAGIFLLIGLSMGSAQTIAFSVGASLDINVSGFVSAGFGVSGIFSFIVNLILDFIISTERIHGILSQKVIILYTICEIIIAINMVMCVLTLPLKKQKIQRSDEIDVKEDGAVEVDKRNMTTKEILKDIHKAIICEFLTNFVTLNIFPTVGPFSWMHNRNRDSNDVTILLGMFQIFDVISRYLPNLAYGNKYLKFLIFSSKNLLICNCVRFIFIAWFVANTFLMGPGVGPLIYLCVSMSVFALTNGWFATLPYIIFTDDLRPERSDKDTEVGASFVVIAMFLGLYAGIWSANIYKLFLPS